MLVRRPPVLEKLKQEIQTVLPNGERLARPHLHKLTYLRCILNESKHPQIPFLSNLYSSPKNVANQKGKRIH